MWGPTLILRVPSLTVALGLRTPIKSFDNLGEGGGGRGGEISASATFAVRTTNNMLVCRALKQAPERLEKLNPSSGKSP